MYQADISLFLKKCISCTHGTNHPREKKGSAISMFRLLAGASFSFGRHIVFILIASYGDSFVKIVNEIV